jgi:hypothetical protein
MTCSAPSTNSTLTDPARESLDTARTVASGDRPFSFTPESFGRHGDTRSRFVRADIPFNAFLIAARRRKLSAIRIEQDPRRSIMNISCRLTVFLSRKARIEQLPTGIHQRPFAPSSPLAERQRKGSNDDA